MTSCERAGCAGTVDETGYCDECGLPPAAPTAHSTTSSVVSTSTGSRRSRDDDPFSLPVFEFPDPSSRIMTDFKVPKRRRRCSNEVCPEPDSLPDEGSGFCLRCGTPFSFLPSLTPGDLVDNRYEVLGCIDRGGQGWIYLAKDKRLKDRLAVLKGLIDTADSALADAELWALTEIDHPNIVGVYNFVKHTDAHTEAERDYIVMEYVGGLPLSTVARDSRHGDPKLSEPLLTEHVITCVLQVLAALEHLHERGLLYCDLKPDNIIMRPGAQGRQGPRIKLIDLGAVRRADDRTSPVVGTRGFEVARSEIAERGLTVRSEIHTVGETLYQLYLSTSDRTGQHLPPAEHAAVQSRIAVGVESFKRVCARARDVDPDKRFASAAEMAEQLRGVQREIASLRDGRPRPEPSGIFETTAKLLEDGLGRVPRLERWIERAPTAPLTDLPLDVGTPSPRAVAVGLPAPRVHPDDPAAEVITSTDDGDTARLLAKLDDAKLHSVEAVLARLRAALEVDDARTAESCLGQAQAQSTGPADWRLWWHDGLMRLAAGDAGPARASFDEVYRALPGEDTPKLALAYCAEIRGELDRAESHYEAVWRRDHTVVNAAFGLARVHLARGDRAGAVARLDEIPAVSRHFDAARIAAVRVLGGTLPNGVRPTEEELDLADTRLAALYLDGGAPTGQSRARLETVVLEARLGRRLATTGAGGASEDALRFALERSYRVLAQQATHPDHHSDLVDLANEHRPLTFS
ncbi:tetratricopeptide repeat protein [Actinosynnema sp. NPDC020468]|uniref:tetratricopeptide repeat protein n=1 Tax=Actinosynnema sp. NPDC020468 TaxID=3154488 RepID=UPI0033E08FF5